MQTLHFSRSHPGTTLALARCAHEPIMGSRAYNYYVYGYFGSYHYCFEFSSNDTNTEQTTL